MPIQVFVFPNGNYAVTDDDGEQLTEVQGSWILIIGERLASAGYNPLEAQVILPGGRGAEFIVTSSGLNWRVLEE